ncbi:MAG: response regulator transcription factor [Actinomycetes bacterium]
MALAPEERPGARRRVLVVDDDPTVAEVVTGYLERAGYAVAHAGDGDEALRVADAWGPDLVVLDLMLPGADGIEVCRRLRARKDGRADVAVIMLTALGEEDDRVTGLEIGADDYVPKPFSPRELVLRVESVLRRMPSGAAPVQSGRHDRPASPTAPPAVLRTGPVELDLDAHRVTRDGQEVPLTMREYDLLAFLMRHAGRAFSREDLMQRVWGWSYGDRSTVTVHIRRLREKIEADPADPRLVVTVWGVGYRCDREGA